MSEIKVSIIVSVYNIETYIEKAMGSLLAQSLNNIQVICVDDKSEDNSLNIIKRYQENDKRIEIIELAKHKGQAYARNQALKIARGKYIGFVDGDDWVKPEMFEKLYNKAEETDADLVLSSAYSYDDKKGEINKENKYFSTDLYDETFDTKVFTYRDNISGLLDINAVIWNKLYKKEFLQQNNITFQEGFIYEDLPFVFEVYTKASKIAIIRDYLYYYRENRQKSTMTNKKNKILDRIDMVSLTLNILKNIPEYESIYPKIFAWVINDLFHRYVLIEPKYHEDFYSKMKKIFLELDDSTISPEIFDDIYYYKEYKLVKTKSIEEFNQLIFQEYVDLKERENNFISEKNKEFYKQQLVYENLIEETRNLTKDFYEKLLDETKVSTKAFYEDEIIQLRRNFDNDFTIQKNKHEQIQEEQRQKNVYLTEQNSLLTQNNERLTYDKSKLEEEHSKLNEYKEHLEREKARLEDENRNINQEKSDLLQEHLKLNEYKDNLEQENSTVKQEKSELLQEHSKLNEYKEYLEQEKARLTQEQIKLNEYKEYLEQECLKEKNYKEKLILEKAELIKKYNKDTKYLRTIIKILGAIRDFYNDKKRQIKNRNSVDKGKTINQKPKVSVILPIYNVGKYLRTSLDSLINQEMKEIQIICVNDGSTDDSDEILKEYQSKDDRIIVVNKPKNEGTGAARNDGLKFATGECIGFVDPDDWVKPNMFKRLYEVLKEKDVDIVMSLPDGFNEGTSTMESFPYFIEDNFSPELDNKIFNWHDISPFKYPMCVWNKLYTKKLFDDNDISFAEGLDFEDHKVIFKTLLCAEKIYFLREKLYVYRFNREGSILSDNNRRLLDHIEVFDIVENILKETNTYDALRMDFLFYKIHNIFYYYGMIKEEFKEEYRQKMKEAIAQTELTEVEINEILPKYPELKEYLN